MRIVSTTHTQQRSPALGYCEFLSTLFTDGRVSVPEISPLLEQDVSSGDEIIAEYERIYRLEMPGTSPRYIAVAGRWAGTRFFRACQFAVYRDLCQETIREELSAPYSEPISPDVHYTIDLIFRYLTDLIRFADMTAEKDPLKEYLYLWAQQWPLSSVGMSGIEQVDIGGIEDNECLMRLYADRVIATNDETRLQCDSVRKAVRSALGMFPDLAQGISTALAEYDTQDINL